MLRLRQIALVAHELEPAVESLRTHLGLEVAWSDPAVAAFGLRNAVLPVGNQFLEIVAPARDGTAAGRYLERRGGDGGYMVILQTDDHAARRRRAAELGIRIALQHDGDEYHLTQLHPADTGGSFLEIDEQIGGDDLDGPWEPAGTDWRQAVRTDVIAGIAAAEIQSLAPRPLAERWSQVLDRPLLADPAGGLTIALDGSTLRFVEATDGRGDGLGGIDFRAAPGGRRPPALVAGVRVRLV
ncbi:MAG: VOC family protein [Actinobacteria bacterium]|nr:VOC family protein [Actinomycetota bacterium]